MLHRIYLTVILVLATVPLWSQADSSGAKPAGEGGAIWSRTESSEDARVGEDAPMITPAPFSDEGYSLAFASETPRTNYLRGGLTVGTVYDDNLVPSSGQDIVDVRYSIWPSLSLQQSRSRLAWSLSYSPGIMVYQRYTSLNGIDHSMALSSDYRLSPHVTLSVEDSFLKRSDIFNLPNASSVQSPVNAILPPATTVITNLGDAALTYQFGPNELIGAKGSISGLWYPNRANLNGLYDSSAVGSEAFYTRRLSGHHYVGATYGLHKLFTHPGHVETQTQSTLLFYTLSLPPTLTMAFFAGPEHSATNGDIKLARRVWSPALGGSLGWHGAHASMVAGYAQRITSGGGLSGAVFSRSTDGSVRWQFTKTLTASLSTLYLVNRVLDSPGSFGNGGHSVSGTASLERSLGEHLGLQMGYTRLHQSYANVPVISNTPNRNNVWVSLSYQFDRPMGR
jgi:hypothetical protein